jgi:hypothetical protein
MNALSAGVTAGTGAFLTGFNQKCVFGFRSYSYATNYKIEYDATNLPGSPTFSILTDGSVHSYFNGFCMFEQYDCRLIDPQCLACTSHSICTDCTPQYYAQNFPNTTGYCLLCADAFWGCDTCEVPTLCLTCFTPTHLMNTTDGTCVYCSNYLDNCQECTDTLTCTLCQPYYGLSGSVCLLCSILMPGCVLCSSATVCTACNPYYGLTGITCTKCSFLITGCDLCSSAATCNGCLPGYFLQNGTCPKCYTGIPNCQLCTSGTVCTLCLSESSLNASTARCDCNPGFVLASNLCVKKGCISAYHF